MQIRRRTKLIGGVAVIAATMVATSGAFTAGGIDDVSNDGFVGGKMSQVVSGATVTNVAYHMGADDEGDLIDTVTVTFDNLDSRINAQVLRIKFRTDPVVPGDPRVDVGVYTCGAITAFVSICTAAGSNRASTQNVNELLINVSET
jgi:hypothetical protein